MSQKDCWFIITTRKQSLGQGNVFVYTPWADPPSRHPLPPRRQLKRAVRILLESILVILMMLLAVTAKKTEKLYIEVCVCKLYDQY